MSGIEFERMPRDELIEARIANMCGQLKCSTKDVARVLNRMEKINTETEQPTEPKPPRPTRDKDRCTHGHQWTAQNTIIRTDGSRNCRICKQANGRAYHRRQRALSLSASMARHPAGKQL